MYPTACPGNDLVGSANCQFNHQGKEMGMSNKDFLVDLDTLGGKINYP
jgi:hypothetical protein